MEVAYENEGTFVDDYRRFRYEVYARMQQWASGHETAVRFGAALALALLTGALAQISFYTPLTPVPFSGQVFGAALMGALLGSRWGAVSGGMYFLMGFVGLPVFAGAWASGQGFEFLRGVDLFTGAIGAGALSAGYLVGFPLQAWIVGRVMEARDVATRRSLVTLATLVGAAVLAIIAVDVYFVASAADYQFAPLTASEVPLANPWLGLLLAIMAVLAVGGLWLALTTKARRERVELFLGNVLGILGLYVVGVLGFAVMWQILDFGPLAFVDLMRFTVFPFLAFDMLKVLGVTGLVTAVRPTEREIREGQTAPAEETA